ncbi:hypothetical protein LX15_003477 [Streptoalloteichus tenebrarius]|uniref:Uncharacterized protein n=1 Tax=Streptoalloteichus tenebrarius (strain ATCC 17920 / DSM 40477 / JCM 4838 / CBS 697.72 / NBRC 16177 / NCIMB 11028 / NRRL B-12390 / A12253. 1 / ISP 5477) TaxID=1933 RepID=A0ABT1HW67_STRSD|nr:hypothetical protein [Streptoalloteichus tenebrarius]BFE99286.1 hypothetical protein GCM10020241_09620 [Streptoalloteichus tenebrarius]
MQTTTSPDALRAEMVDRIRKSGHAQRSEVERVLRDTARHEFVPDADLAVVYDPWQAVVTHRFEDGRSLSCASATLSSRRGEPWPWFAPQWNSGQAATSATMARSQPRSNSSRS